MHGLSRYQGSLVKEEGVSGKILTEETKVLVRRTISYLCSFSAHDLVYSCLVRRTDSSYVVT